MKVNEFKKGEMQKHLFENSNNTTTNVTSVPFELQLPENAWTVLSQFANLRVNDLPMSLSVSELSRIFGKHMHINTIRSMVKRLREEAYIRIHVKHVGKTGREIRYLITTDGMVAWSRRQDL